MKNRMYLLCFLLPCWVAAQPFREEIQAFKQQDAVQPPPPHPVLFVGSSSFRMWHDVRDYFPGYTILNRGFGGSSLPDLIRYEEDVIFAYQPKQIVMYCGENDLANDSTVTGTVVFQRFKQLFGDIRKKLPGVPLVYVSMKPSPSREHLLPHMREGNRLIRNFLKGQKKTVFVDIYSKMLTPEGKPDETLFLEDRLHMNAAGYLIWQKVLVKHLKK